MDPRRNEMLAKALTVLMLYPEIHIHDQGYKQIHTLASNIGDFYSALGEKAEFRRFEKSDT
jgi:hypothetical protein